METYIGLDVSLASTAVCAVSAQGKIVKETTAASEPEDLVATLKAMPGDVIAVGLEAGPLSQWLYRHLTDAGFATVLMETRQVKGTLKAMPIKTDRRDAEGIARLLQMGWYRPVHCKSVSSQEMRALLSARKAVQQAAINLELSIRGVLRNFGLKMGRVAKGRFHWPNLPGGRHRTAHGVVPGGDSHAAKGPQELADCMGIECRQAAGEKVRYCRARPTDRGGSPSYVEGRHRLPLHPGRGRTRCCCIAATP